jgi:Biotin-requiring enzyme
MSEIDNQPEESIAAARSRVRGSGPIIILAALFVAATFVAWYFTWFGRGLSDAEISTYLSDTRNPRHVQHALLQIQQRMERKDTTARNWYPQLMALSTSDETEYRLTVSWIMGFDNQDKGFHEALLRLVRDDAPIVRRNAALALIRFNDPSGRQELVAILQPYGVKATAGGLVTSTLHAGSEVSRGTLLARIQQADGAVVEVRSPLPGRINKIADPNGAQVSKGEEILTLNSDEESVWEALRGLSFIGTADDLEIVHSYAASSGASPRVREQAALTEKAIRERAGL